jgi:hypothetical protein
VAYSPRRSRLLSLGHPNPLNLLQLPKFSTRTKALNRSHICLKSLDLQEYGVTKKWVIITQISKEIENKNIGRLNVVDPVYVYIDFC